MRARIAIAVAVASIGLATAGPAPAMDVVTSRNGSNVYATGAVLRSYDRGPAGALQKLDWEEPGGTFLALSPDGTVLYEAAAVQGNYQNSIRIFSRDPGSGVLTYERTFLEAGAKSFDLISGMALSPDGRFLYVSQGGHWSPYMGQASGDPAIHVLSTGADGEQLSFAQTLWQEDHGMAAIDAITLAPGGQLYASGDGGIRRFDRNAATGALTPTSGVTPTTQVGPLVLAPDGGRLYAGAHSWDPEAYDVFDRDTTTGELTRIAGSADHCAAATCPVGDVLGTSPDGKTVFSAPRAYPHSRILVQGAVTDDGVVSERSYGRTALPDAEKPYAIAWSPDGTFAYVASENRGGNDVVLSVLHWNAQVRTLSLVETQKGTREPPPKDQFPTISINDGELATNDPNVTISFEPPAGATSFRLSNDVDTLDEGRAIRVSKAGVYRWRLDTSGPPSRTVRKVYLRVTQSWDFHQSRPVELFDDIVFDQQPPELESARLTAADGVSTLVVRAHDKASGIKRMQLARSLRRPAKVRPFAHRLKVAGNPKSVYVRVIDGAGNRGRWRLAKRG